MTENKSMEVTKKLPQQDKTDSLIEKYADKEHPMDKANVFSKLTMNWITNFVRIGNKKQFQQKYHPKLPKGCEIEDSHIRLKEAYQKKPTMAGSIF